MENCPLEFSNIFVFFAGGILLTAIYFIFKFKLFKSFVLLLIFNSIVAWKTHLNETVQCFNFENFFYIWRVLTISEIPILVTVFGVKLLLNYKNWDSRDRVKFMIVVMVWITELYFVLNMFKII